MTRDPNARARRLVRWYPRAWRERYGDEFTALLVADLRERPRCLRRTADVAAGALRARAAAAGLAGDPTIEVASGTSLAALAGAFACSLVCATAVWSQLAVGWHWSQPDSTATSAGVLVMSAMLAALAVLVLLAAVPLVWAVAAGLIRRQAGLAAPLVLTAVGIAVLVAGCRHFHVDWPGVAGHPWSGRAAVPGGPASYAWALTLSFSAYWVHPHALLRFPAAEIVWMVMSPVAMAMVAAGAATIVRRVQLGARSVRYLGRLGSTAAVAMLAFLAGCGCWLLAGSFGRRGLYQAGTIDLAACLWMSVGLAVVRRAARAASIAR